MLGHGVCCNIADGLERFLNEFGVKNRLFRVSTNIFSISRKSNHVINIIL